MTTQPQAKRKSYRGRIAPSPTGYLHLGHAKTFWTAQQRARQNNGTLILRNEDIDQARCKPGFVNAMTEDLHWFGFEWDEGPDVDGPHGPYVQSERFDRYREALEELKAGQFAYPCTCSRKDIQQAASAPQGADDELIYPGTCRSCRLSPPDPQHPNHASWRFRVPDGEIIEFTDFAMGPQQFVAGEDFGDFVLWRNDDVPAYQLAVVVDDAAMDITEVVRGADLLVSTARQILLYRALNFAAPAFHHCPLVADEAGVRLAKRTDAMSLRTLRDQGFTPEELRSYWGLTG